MKFLLVALNAKYIHSNLAVYSLRAYAQEYGNGNNEIEIAEYTINQYADEILQDIYERRPDVIGFSCYIWNIKMIREIVCNYKKVCPKADIWVGGPEVSYNVEQVLDDNRGIDFVVYGEGEETFREITDLYNNGKLTPDMAKNVDGIAFRDKDNIVITKPRVPVDLSDIPFVYKDMKDFENKIIYYETSRGCPFSCSYCLSSIDKTLRFRSLDLVKNELQFFIDQKTSQVKFVDRTFNCKHSHAMEIWKYIKEHDNGVTNFHFEIAADIMKDDEIELISTMRPGLIQLEIGVQSTNDVTIETINRKTDFEKIKETTEKIKENGNIHQHLDLIAGLPYEDYETFKKSFNDVYSLKPDQLQLGFLKVLHGSAMETLAEDGDIVYSDMPPYEVLCTKWLSFDEVLKLKLIEEVVEIYYNSFQFDNSITELEQYFETPFALYEALGEFYHEHHINGAKHSRVDRYYLLKNFADEYIRMDISEFLTKDFYLRENAKSRPEFAPDLNEHRDKIRKYFREEKFRKLLPEYRDYDFKQVEKMTHVEVFGMGTGKETYILFNYKNRNPLNHQAAIIDITEWMVTDK